METALPKYFVTKVQGEYMVIYEDFCPIGGNFYSTEKSGFATEKDAQIYADEINTKVKGR